MDRAGQAERGGKPEDAPAAKRGRTGIESPDDVPGVCVRGQVLLKELEQLRGCKDDRCRAATWAPESTCTRGTGGPGVVFTFALLN